MRQIGVDQLDEIARGAAVLGTGGGGDPFVGKLMARAAMERNGPVTLLDQSELDDDALVIPTAMMGAPTCIVEKLPQGIDAVNALRRLESHLGRTAYATMPIEAGGVNSMIPLVIALRLGIPAVGADGMGRAFPELFHETFHIHGVSGTPMVVSNEQGDHALIDTHDTFAMEWLARGLMIRMGGVADIAENPMDGSVARHCSVRGTIGLGLAIGRALRRARERHDDPIAALIAHLATTDYSPAGLIFGGNVVDVERRTREGFAKGTVAIQERRSPADQLPATMEIEFQNENPFAAVKSRVLASVPDLIPILDADTAEPITTEELQYGQRVQVMAVRVPEIKRSSAALDVWGPRHFGFDHDYLPFAN